MAHLNSPAPAGRSEGVDQFAERTDGADGCRRSSSQRPGFGASSHARDRSVVFACRRASARSVSSGRACFEFADEVGSIEPLEVGESGSKMAGFRADGIANARVRPPRRPRCGRGCSSPCCIVRIELLPPSIQSSSASSSRWVIVTCGFWRPCSTDRLVRPDAPVEPRARDGIGPIRLDRDDCRPRAILLCSIPGSPPDSMRRRRRQTHCADLARPPRASFLLARPWGHRVRVTSTVPGMPGRMLSRETFAGIGCIVTRVLHRQLLLTAVHPQPARADTVASLGRRPQCPGDAAMNATMPGPATARCRPPSDDPRRAVADVKPRPGQDNAVRNLPQTCFTQMPVGTGGEGDLQGQDEGPGAGNERARRLADPPRARGGGPFH